MLDSDIKTYLSAEVSSASTNGGRMSANQVISGVVNNVFPHVTRAQRASGHTLYRLLYDKAADDTDGTMLNTWKWIERFLAAGDYVVMFFADYGETQADISGTEEKYGYAYLKNPITAGASSFTVTVPNAAIAPGGADAIVADLKKIRLADMATPDSGTGNEEFLTINGTPTVDANGVDVNITVNETIANNYAAWDGSTGGFIVSYEDKGDIACSFDAPVITGSGSWDTGANPPILDNIGTIKQTITLTFDGAGNFTAVSDVAGVSLPSGAVGTDWIPTNPDFSKPYLAIEANVLSGFANGDTLELTTYPAAFAYWLKRVVPASCPSLANNKITGVVAAESAV